MAQASKKTTGTKKAAVEKEQSPVPAEGGMEQEQLTVPTEGGELGKAANGAGNVELQDREIPETGLSAASLPETQTGQVDEESLVAAQKAAEEGRLWLVQSVGERFFRCGMQFDREGVVVELTDEQIAIIQDDPNLKMTRALSIEEQE